MGGVSGRLPWEHFECVTNGYEWDMSEMKCLTGESGHPTTSAPYHHYTTKSPEQRKEECESNGYQWVSDYGGYCNYNTHHGSTSAPHDHYITTKSPEQRKEECQSKPGHEWIGDEFDGWCKYKGTYTTPSPAPTNTGKPT